MIALNLDQSEKLFDAVASGTGDSADFALPARATQITWQTSFASNPASITVQIKTSNDGLTFTTVDSSTVVSGESKTFVTSAIFIRARINAISGGSGITVSVVPKVGFIGTGSPSLTNLTLSGNLTVGGTTSITGNTTIAGSLTANSLTLTTPYNPFDQDLNITDDVIFNSLIAAGLTYPVADGTNGQVLTTDGSGNLTFQNAGGSITLPGNTQVLFDDSGSVGGFGSWNGSAFGVNQWRATDADVAPITRTVTSLTSASTTATAVSMAHGFYTGTTVTISGARQHDDFRQR